MNDHEINWTGILAIIALLEFLRSLVIYLFISPLRGAGKKIDHLEKQIDSLNLTNVQHRVEDHEERGGRAHGAAGRRTSHARAPPSRTSSRRQ